MNNIFENAYFGKAYKTRDDRKAIYLGDNNFNGSEVYVAYEGYTSSHRIMKDGRYWATPNVNTDDDIVSEWEEPIDEEHLDDLVLKYITKISLLDKIKNFIIKHLKMVIKKVRKGK